MIFPTLNVEVHRSGGTDLYGQAVLTRLADERCAPVRLLFSQQHTTVRTDSAASHGSAMESQATCVLLLLPTTNARIEDMLVVMGHKLRVVERHQRFTPTGLLDHVQIKLLAWA